MSSSFPYSALEDIAFWKACRTSSDFLLGSLYQPKVRLNAGMKVATAGSCFAQNVSRYLRKSDLSLVDVEPPPAGMDEELAGNYGYGLFSARYGNIYTTRQLLQLLQDAITEKCHECAIWENQGRYFDALRPYTEPEGLETPDEVKLLRLDHLRRVRSIFSQADVFIFTLGLTETWADRDSGVVFPSVPGLIAGNFDTARHHFLNMSYHEALTDLQAAISLIREVSPDLEIILTVSPVPLTATASGQHVLQANTYSKAVLRAVAGEISAKDKRTDYFPSYEAISGLPGGDRFFSANMRNVSEATIQKVMGLFFEAHELRVPDMRKRKNRKVVAKYAAASDEPFCEDAMLDAFAPK